MVRQAFLVGAVCVAGIITGCSDSETPPNAPPAGDASVPVPAGVTAVFSEGFGGDLTKWDSEYMINVGDFYPHMKITIDVAHTGTHSITSDSNRCALQYIIAPKLEALLPGSGGVQFFIMAKVVDSINFTVAVGQNAGSSGGLVNAFGMGFDLGGTLKCTYKDGDGTNDSTMGAIQVNKWYKCRINVYFDAQEITYYLDDVLVRTLATPTREFMGLDRMLVFRGDGNHTPAGDYFAAKEGPKQYYVDDITVYKK